MVLEVATLALSNDRVWNLEKRKKLQQILISKQKLIEDHDKQQVHKLTNTSPSTKAALLMSVNIGQSSLKKTKI